MSILVANGDVGDGYVHLFRRPLASVIASVVGAAMFLALPWQIALVVATLVWLGLWQVLKRLPGASFVGDRLMYYASAVARRTMVEARHATYLFTVIGLGVFIPAVFVVSIGYQLSELAAGGGLNWWVVFATHVLWLGPNHLFFGHVTTLGHHHGHQRKLFRRGYGFLDVFVAYGLGVLYGHVPENFAVGHVRIHHKFDNGVGDVTSTMHLDRSKFRGWMAYRNQFLLYWTGASVVHYFLKHNKAQFAIQQLKGMLWMYGLTAAVCLYNFELGFAYFVLPQIMVINFLSAINFTWHAFIDPEDPSNKYRNSITILGATQDVWNEAHHISHHLKPQATWDEMPQHYRKHREKYAEERANLFEKTQVFEIFMMLMLGKTKRLAEHFVDLSGRLSDQEKVELIEQRLQPIEPLDGRPV